MIRKLKFLLPAALALGLIAPIAAHAAVFTNVNGGNTIITGSSDGAATVTGHHVMNFPGISTLTCNSINLQGTASNKEFAEMTMTAGYAGCTFLGKLATVNMQGCDYLFRANGGFKIASAVEKNCATSPMEIIVTNCTITVGEQEFASGITYHPHGAEEATTEVKLTKISGKATGSACPIGAFANGEYTTGNTVFTAESDDGKQTMKPFGMDTP